jgi:hypothetical protein
MTRRREASAGPAAAIVVPLVPPITRAQTRRIDEVLEAKRLGHPELRRPLTEASLRTLLEREGVRLVIRPHPRDEELLPIAGRWVIIVDRRQERAAWLVLACHGLAHYWLHIDATEPIAFDRSPEWYDDVRELEANYVAERLIAGPVTSGNSKRNTLRAKRPSTTLPPLPPVPSWIDARDLEAEAAEDAAIAAAARQSQREYARDHASSPARVVQFAIDRNAWSTVRFGVPSDYPHYSSYQCGTSHEFVSCSLAAARSIVEQLARAGYKRTAVFVRRRVREAEAYG